LSFWGLSSDFCWKFGSVNKKIAKRKANEILNVKKKQNNAFFVLVFFNTKRIFYFVHKKILYLAKLLSLFALFTL